MTEPSPSCRERPPDRPSPPLASRAVFRILFWLLAGLTAWEGHPWTALRQQRAPTLAVAPDDRCRVRVCFWDMGTGFYHAYILTSDRHGTTHFRAGPAHPGPIAETIWALLGGKGSKARQWGPLRAEHGPYIPGSVDYDAGSPPSMTLLQDGAPCGILNLRLTGAEIALNSAEIPYNPLTTNSNAFVPYALSWIHLAPGAPPVSAPGWDTVLRP